MAKASEDVEEYKPLLRAPLLRCPRRLSHHSHGGWQMD